MKSDKNTKMRPMKTFSRSSVIIKLLIGLDIYVHNGKSFDLITIRDNMVGHKLGEFSFTRVYGNIHNRKKNRKR
ncbi:UNVERIFIED_CONTAM: hypothetical protein GTU68_065754 [Idotea baltica]|nr:hypothetical protein [Idotea baltica]